MHIVISEDFLLKISLILYILSFLSYGMCYITCVILKISLLVIIIKITEIVEMCLVQDLPGVLGSVVFQLAEVQMILCEQGRKGEAAVLIMYICILIFLKPVSVIFRYFIFYNGPQVESPSKRYIAKLGCKILSNGLQS